MTAALGAAAMLPLGEAQQLLGLATAAAPLAAEILPGLGPQLDAAGMVLPAALEVVRAGWEGAASLGADRSLTAVGASLTELGSSAAEIAGLTVQAAQIVIGGAGEIAVIVQNFTATAAGMVPALVTPGGQVALLGLVADAVGKALAVVERVRGELAVPTARMWQIAAEVGGTAVASLPVPEVNPGAVAAQAAQAVPAAWSAPTAAQPAGGVAAGSLEQAAVPDSGSAQTQPVPLPSGSTEMAPNPQAAAAVEAAKTQLGVGYVWGGHSPGSGFDCSGLTQWAYREAGVDIPRTSYEQDVGRQISREELAPGDLVLWDGHVAMYVGDGQMIEAGDPVGISPLRSDNMGMPFQGYFRPTEQG